MARMNSMPTTATIAVVALLLFFADAAFVLAGDTHDGSEGVFNGTKCRLNDYVPAYGPCLANSTRLRSWTKAKDANCVSDASVLPSASYVPCAVCSLGMQHRDQGESIGDCGGCAVGEYLDVSARPPTCATCPFGTTAVPVLAFRDGFDGFSGNVSALHRSSASRFVYPDSGSAPFATANNTEFEFVGFRRGGRDELLVGLRPPRKGAGYYYAYSTFRYTFEALSDGWVEIVFALQRPSGDGGNSDSAAVRLEELDHIRSVLVVDHTTVDVRAAASTVITADPADAEYSVVVPFFHSRSSSSVPDSAGTSEHSLSWKVQESYHYSSSIDIVIRSLVVSGDVSGGTEVCEPCPPGFACPPQTTKASACTPGTYQPATHALRCLTCTGNTYSPGYGFRECLTCDDGRTANEKHTACSDTCVFAYEDVLYNFTAMAGVVLNATVGDASYNPARYMSVEEADAAALDRVYLSVCGALPIRNAADHAPSRSSTTDDDRGRWCVRDVWNHNSSTSAYVCERTNATVGRHFGNVTQLMSVGGRASVVTSMGSLLAPVDMRANASTYSERTWRAVIQLECRDDADEARKAGTVTADEVGADSLTLTWRSVYACPLCTEKSFTRSESRCNGSSMHTVEYAKINSTVCTHGFAPPPLSVLNCTPCLEEFYTLEWGECDAAARSQTGVYVLKPEREGCTLSDSWQPQNQTRICTVNPANTGIAKTLSVMIVVFALFLVFGLVAAVMFPSRFRRQEYRLGDRESGTELGEYNLRNDGIDGLELHYNVASAVDGGDAAAPHAGASRVSSLADRLLHSMASTLRRFGLPARGPTSRDNGYNTLPTTDGAFPPEESSQRPSRVGGRRNEVLFTLEDGADDDILPPLPSR
ncbi:hypothetical protein ABB37_00036 [Leptomonas pyrrhocoris]|uniref:Tyrosine-protein kinase ephrin type A/B receptor-like domain-containing protein n=1 Tax=Leptomonas pyrrhocoris TaxID=157538 RepID=A0A0N0VHG1_LEPPY|nr:hypothetical protein ABB37_00036 [Leptomonas pyrrhocoris]KPA85634.1 hypothetical protein ABB37_00036 [Leptomonas pyrrhocoris]|eukprot:XP_015664073.1 hypothetical protein ABB37_00036 [Leptomonas pyrrhocoris]